MPHPGGRRKLSSFLDSRGGSSQDEDEDPAWARLPLIKSSEGGGNGTGGSFDERSRISQWSEEEPGVSDNAFYCNKFWLVVIFGVGLFSFILGV